MIAKVTPVFKGDDSADLSNYRPIPVLSCFSKILERLKPVFHLSTFFVAKIFDNGKYKKHATNKIRSSRPEVF